MRDLVAFFFLTYIVTWTCFAAAGASWGGASPLSGLSAFRGPLFLLGTFAPSLVALALTAGAHGRAGMLALLRRIFVWPADARWYVFAVGYMLSIKLAAALVHRAETGAWPRFGHEPLVRHRGGDRHFDPGAGRRRDRMAWVRPSSLGGAPRSRAR